MILSQKHLFLLELTTHLTPYYQYMHHLFLTIVQTVSNLLKNNVLFLMPMHQGHCSNYLAMPHTNRYKRLSFICIHDQFFRIPKSKIFTSTCLFVLLGKRAFCSNSSASSKWLFPGINPYCMLPRDLVFWNTRVHKREASPHLPQYPPLLRT